jgi:hypothetical protein
MPPPEHFNGLISWVDNFVRQKKMAKIGDRVVMVAGLSMTAPGTVNNLVIQTVGEELPRGDGDFPRLAHRTERR